MTDTNIDTNIQTTQVNPLTQEENLQQEEFVLGEEEEEPQGWGEQENAFKEKINSQQQQQFSKMINEYLVQAQFYAGQGQSRNESPELEVRFGTRGKKVTKIDYDNVIKKLLSLGFTTPNSMGEYRLSAQTEYLNESTGTYRSSNIRAEINGLDDIQRFCKKDSLDIENRVRFLRKTPINDSKGEIIRDVIFKDFNFSVSLKLEHKIGGRSPIVKSLRSSWNTDKKTFRYMNRVSFSSDRFPAQVDLSIVRSSLQNIPRRTISESKVFESDEVYEIEIELNNKQIGNSNSKYFNNPDLVMTDIKRLCKIILSGLQGSNFPISISEQYDVLQNYMRIVYQQKGGPLKINTGKFIGPSSYTLQIQNIAEKSEHSNVPNIRDNYTVTDKADGERQLMIISPIGKIYLMNTNMNIIFTGTVTKNRDIFNTIIDGELIVHNKVGVFINLFAAFDIYFIENKNVRDYPFVPSNTTSQDGNFRYLKLVEVINSLNAESIIPNDLPAMTFINKKFYSTKDMNIFEACNIILTKQREGLFDYNIDGLIFTPSSFGVGGSSVGQSGPLKKFSWEYSFKWKPTEYNTIDFLVTTKKDTANQDVITPIFTDGLQLQASEQLTQYKTLVLRCGFNEAVHGSMNPCLDVIEDNVKTINSDKLEERYERKPVQFYPTTPADNMAGICNIELRKDSTGAYKMFTEEHEVFGDKTIVEFKFNKEKYDANGNAQWCWVPLRVRYDKTADYKKGGTNFGNEYHVANNNWYSIHYPITVSMITTGANIVVPSDSDDTYYKNTTKTNLTRGLRDFHNLFVKKMLIKSVARNGDRLIDYACGKAGDLPKWIDANLSFVFGIDYSKDNLENRINGACARYLAERSKYNTMPYALFVNGDSSLNIRNGRAMLNDRAKQITNAVFGNGAKSEALGKGVLRQFGVAMNGFQISSCQFALHYFFKNAMTLHNFMRNLSECTSLNGYFIGTCYDGKTIFSKLASKQLGEGIDIYEDMKKVWGIVKNYQDEFLEDEDTCLGKEIMVYQESIGKLIPEYLMNFSYLVRVAENYGFVLHKPHKSLLPDSTGMFRDLFNFMTKTPNPSEYKNALQMTDYEKQISFLNRYFIFQKVRSVNAENVANNFINGTPFDSNEELEPPPPPPVAVIQNETIQLHLDPNPTKVDAKKPKKAEEKAQAKAEAKAQEKELKAAEKAAKEAAKAAEKAAKAEAKAEAKSHAQAKKLTKKAEPKNTTKKNKTAIKPNEILGNVTRHATPPRRGEESKGDEKTGYLY